MGNQDGKFKKYEYNPSNNYQGSTGYNVSNISNNQDSYTQQRQNVNRDQLGLGPGLGSNKNLHPNNDYIENINDVNNYQCQTPKENQDKYQNPNMLYLNKAFLLFNEAGQHAKNFSFYEALIKYEEAQKITTEIYPKISDDSIMKVNVDKFLQNINSQIDFVNFQIKNRFSYKEKAGYATRDSEKRNVDYLEVLRKDNQLIDYNKNNILTTKIKAKDTDQNATTKNITTTNEKEIKVVSDDLRSRILNEIVDNKPGVKFSDVIGLEEAKQILKEIIVLPSIRPDLFTGLRSPPRGLLLFGPPGVGKTMIAKAVATECKCTFFNISASSLTSKYLGESEKLVRALFDLAFEKQPSVIFIDEIESILGKRSDNENEATKRLKTEFLVQFDGVGSDQTAKVLIIGATNRPQELDSAVIRRLPKRIYITPFDILERKSFIESLMKNNENKINDDEFESIANLTNNYSNSDLKELCREAAYETIREISSNTDNFNNVNKLRPTSYNDFLKAIKKVRGTLNEKMLYDLVEWNQSYGAIN